MKRLSQIVILLTLFTHSNSFPQAVSDASYKVPAAKDDGWKTEHADELGVDSKRLSILSQSIRAWPELGVHAILIERDQRLIYEEYFDGFDEQWGEPLGKISMTMDRKHDLRSVTKSVLSSLVGIAHGEGSIPDLNQPLVQWFPEYPELNTPERRRVTLGHVLSMTSGFEWNEEIPYNDPRNDEIKMTKDPQPLRYALAPAFADPPGTAFNYNGGLTQVMAAVLVRATKTSLQEYARKKLFEPLGITDVEWMGDLAGMPSAASGLRLRARDLAKFGSLYLHDGKWNGKQVIPASWIELSTQRHISIKPRGSADPAAKFGYGYFWWYNCYPTAGGLIEARTAVGNGQQRIFVLPEFNMVVTIFAGRYNDFANANTLGKRILVDHVVPAVKSGLRYGCPGA